MDHLRFLVSMWLLVTGCWLWNSWNLVEAIKWRRALTPDAHGIIHHPKYGDYPAIVPYRDGMTLMPEQRAVAFIPVSPATPNPAKIPSVASDI